LANLTVEVGVVIDPEANPAVGSDSLRLMPADAESFELEAALRREAAEVRDDLELETRLHQIGAPVLVGSAAMHVMVRRDLDITTICTALAGSEYVTGSFRAACTGVGTA
jgi:hypothetical protein